MAAPQDRLRANGTVAYRYVYRLAGKQRVETFDTDAARQLFANQFATFGAAYALETLAARQNSHTPAMTVTDWVTHHVDLIPNVTNGTRGTYRSMNARLIAPMPIGHVPVDQLDRTMVERWVLDLHREHNLSAKSVRNVQGLLSAAMTRAVRDGVKASNPVVGVKPAATQRKAERVYLSSSEFAVFISHIPAHYQSLVTTLYGTGLRFGEATALRIQDVDLAGTPPTLHVSQAWKHTVGGPREVGPPKSEAAKRTISLPAPLPRLLAPLTTGRARSDYVFTNHAGGPVRANTFYASTWRPAVDDAEPAIHKRPTIHAMRHSHVSNLIRAGVPLNIIQRRLGHEKITTTVDTYGHLGEDHLWVAAQSAALSLVEAYPELKHFDDAACDRHHGRDTSCATEHRDRVPCQEDPLVVDPGAGSPDTFRDAIPVSVRVPDVHLCRHVTKY
jgi:integrase